MKKVIGKVTETERNEIKDLFERKASLSQLFRSADEESINVYNKTLAEFGKTSYDLRKWWDEKSKQYNWESEEGFSWEIDFDNCEICLVRK